MPSSSPTDDVEELDPDIFVLDSEGARDVAEAGSTASGSGLDAPATAVARERPGRLPALDGLRAIAVFAVIAYHLGPIHISVGGSDRRLQLGGGFTGVDVFFVLSGFLISWLLLAEVRREGRVSLGAFWLRRVRRLVPAMVVTAALAVLGARWLLPSWRWAGVRADALASIAYVANWRLVLSDQSYFGVSGVSPLRHTWSLAVEEQFYLLWPLLAVAVFAVARRRRRLAFGAAAAVVAVASAAAMAIGSRHGEDPSRLYYGTDTRIFAMAIGGVLAAFFDPLRSWLAARSLQRGAALVLTLLGTVGLAWSFWRVDNTAPFAYRGGLVLVALIAAVVVLGLALDPPVVGTALGSGPLAWLGVRAYGLYLYSWPIQTFFDAKEPTASRALRVAVVVGLTVVAATVSYALIERPILDRRAPWTRRGAKVSPSSVHRRLGPVLVSVAGLLLVGLVWVGGSGGDPAPSFLNVDDQEAIDRATADPGFGATTIALGPVVTAPPGSTPLDPGADPPFDPADTAVVTSGDVAPESIHGRPLRVVVFGDSSAASLTWDIEGRTSQVDVAGKAIVACGAMPVTWTFFDHLGEQHQYPGWCNLQTEVERDGILAGPDVVLLWVGSWEVFDQADETGARYEVGTDRYAQALRGRIQDRVDLARTAGIPTVLALVPCFDIGADPTWNVRRQDPERLAWVNDQVRAVAARNPGWVRLIDPGVVLCPGGTVRHRDDAGDVIRPDGSHFEGPTAIWMWDSWLAGAIATALTN